MKYFLKCLPLLLALLLTFTACRTREAVDETNADNPSVTTTAGGTGDTNGTGNTGNSGKPEDTRSLKEIYDAYIAEVDIGVLTLVETPVDGDNFSYYFGITDTSVAESTFVSEPMIGSVPFGISMLRVKDGEDAAKIAAEMKAGIDPHRWVCVTASYVETAVNGDVILLVLDDDAARGAAIVEAFRNQ